MSSDDEWKDGVPPLPSGVAPAAPSDTSWAPGPVPAPSEPPPADQPLAQYAAPPPGVPVAPPAGPDWYAPPPAPIGRGTAKNWMGIASLIFGVIGGIVLALIFGLLSLNAYREGKANNRGFAIAGLSAAGGWVLLFALIAVGATVFDNADQTIGLKQAQVGDCFTSSLEETDSLDEGYYSFSPCSDSTNGIVYFVTAVDAAVAYSDPGITDALWEACTSEFALAGVDTELATDYYVEYYVGSSQDWTRGDHTVVCGLSTAGTLDYDVLLTAEPHLAD